MMRREELLGREAWTLEDASIRHAIELFEHGDRISRLIPLPVALSSHEVEGSTKLKFPSAPRANTREKAAL